uniref:U-box domain containing 5 n=1 Tax=Oryzias latipes TaxID=8090 RepID=H2LFX9_ORYLA
MVVNLCLPHFQTTVHCNKLCADGYEVTNLVSADPALRRRGFKFEYFLRPPLQVILKFGFQVELSRVDVELWPWGMDRGQACKRLEISTSSDLQNCGPTDHKQLGQKEQKKEFKLVSRCELRDETHVCFFHSNFRPRVPFLSLPPQPPENSRQVELWSRGLASLGAVTQLRVTVPFGGGGSSLGLKALAVWGQPASRCTAEEVERIKRIHESAQRQLSKPAFFGRPVRQATPPQQSTPRFVIIPEEFLDPITQEAMLLPLLLPSGMSVDSTTLDEYQKREAGWGRPPNDPFTGVPFTPTSQPLPNPQLKSRIDRYLLQKGIIKRDGMLGGQNPEDNPHASRLVTTDKWGQTQSSPSFSVSSPDNRDTSLASGQRESGKVCSACSCSVSVYSTSASCIYRLTCSHLLCRTCLQKESKPTSSTSALVLCPTCLSRTHRSRIIRVHH